MSNSEQEEEKKQAFDLLDALSRSGSLDVDYASLHVVVAATHCFAESLMNTVVKDNINPIEKVLFFLDSTHRPYLFMMG